MAWRVARSMRDRKLDVVVWQTSSAISVEVPARSTIRVFPEWTGLLGTVLVHAFALQVYYTCTQTVKLRLPDAQGLGSTLIESEVAPSETLILLDLPTATMTDKPLIEDLASAGPGAKELRVALISPDSLPHIDIPAEYIDEKAAVAVVDTGDPTARAALFGRYTGQIDGRIERAWRRPRSPVNPKFMPLPQNASASTANGALVDSIFRCQVRIIQDQRGNVQEVQMLDCNGSVAWQRSLVAAIAASSPLPAPPNPTVFTKAVTMTFSAHPYAQGSVADEYEIERKVTVSD